MGSLAILNDMIEVMLNNVVSHNNNLMGPHSSAEISFFLMGAKTLRPS